jgi:hypothetical protein
VPNNKDPVFPLLDDPVLNTIMPLTPEVPALDVVTTMLPLEYNDDVPLVSTICPPEVP